MKMALEICLDGGDGRTWEVELVAGTTAVTRIVDVGWMTLVDAFGWDMEDGIAIDGLWICD